MNVVLNVAKIINYMSKLQSEGNKLLVLLILLWP